MVFLTSSQDKISLWFVVSWLWSFRPARNTGKRWLAKDVKTFKHTKDQETNSLFGEELSPNNALSPACSFFAFLPGDLETVHQDLPILMAFPKDFWLRCQISLSRMYFSFSLYSQENLPLKIKGNIMSSWHKNVWKCYSPKFLRLFIPHRRMFVCKKYKSTCFHEYSMFKEKIQK